MNFIKKNVYLLEMYIYSGNSYVFKYKVMAYT